MTEMKITIHNVGRGSAVLIELPPRKGSPKPIGIVDCFSGPVKEMPLLNELARLDRAGDLSIEFFVITHLHADHFIGIREILDQYGPKIKKFFDPGLEIRQIIFAEFFTGVKVDAKVQANLLAIQAFKDQYPERLRVLSCPDTDIYEDAENGLTVRSVAPNGGMLNAISRYLSDHFGRVVKAMKNKETDFEICRISQRKYNLNRTSSAVQIAYRGKTIVLGGDVLRSAWNIVVDGGVIPEADVFLLSHHGSADAFPLRRWDRMLRDKGNTIVSGYGKGQPSATVLNFLRRSGVSLWGTNIPSVNTNANRVLQYVTKLHYNVNPKINLKQGNVTCTVGDELQIEGPRIL